MFKSEWVGIGIIVTIDYWDLLLDGKLNLAGKAKGTDGYWCLSSILFSILAVPKFSNVCLRFYFLPFLLTHYS